MINGILALSTSLRDKKFPFWTDCNGTFGSLLYSAMKEKGLTPKAYDIDCRGRKLTILATGKTKNIKNCSVNGIMKML